MKMTENAKEIAEELRAGMERMQMPGCGCFINITRLSKLLGKSRGTVRQEFKDLPRYGNNKELKIIDVAKHLDKTQKYIP